MRTQFETYLIDSITDSINDFDGDLEEYGLVFAVHTVELSDLQYYDWMTWDHIGEWLVQINQEGQINLTRYRTHMEAFRVWRDLNELYEAYLETVEDDEE